VLWDPAGTWWHPTVPERNDVLFGMNPTVYDFYLDYHARETFHVVLQEVEVSPEVADQALALVKANGAAGNATCAITTSRILQALGLPQMSPSYFPVQVMEDFAKLPGVSSGRSLTTAPIRIQMFCGTAPSRQPRPQQLAKARAKKNPRA